MEDSQDACIQERMVCVSLKVVGVRKEHDIMVGGVGIDYILRSSDIICCVIEPTKLMAIDAIIFEEHRVTGGVASLALFDRKWI